MSQLTKLPQKPGIYRFLDQQGNLLYIGKAKNLKNRVKSYFTRLNSLNFGGFAKTAELSPIKQQLVQKIKKIQFTVVTNETEALLLERNLIKKYQPPYNVDLKDDKSWLYVAITNENFPKIILTRKNIARFAESRRGKAFGPYTSATAIRQTLSMLRKIFPYYSESGPMIDLSKNWRSRLHLGRYLNKPMTDKKEWLKNIKLIKKFLNGKVEDFKITLQKKMLSAAKKKNFEQAGLVRDQLKALEIISQKQQVLKNNEIDENYLMKIRKNFQAMEQLKKILKLNKPLLRIEAYDISNIMGQMAVGSMVAFIDGLPEKSQYRRFKIKTIKSANDPAMIGEVIKRRFRHAEWLIPDLILIDGGLTQLNAAILGLKQSGFKLPIISLAKREERIYSPSETTPIKLTKFSPALQLLQRIRDEAHRFAVNYYRKLHSKTYSIKHKA